MSPCKFLVFADYDREEVSLLEIVRDSNSSSLSRTPPFVTALTWESESS